MIWEVESYNVVRWLCSTLLYMWSCRGEATSFERQLYTYHAAVKKTKSTVKGGVLPKHLSNKSAENKSIDTSTYWRGENAWDGFDHVSVAWKWKVATKTSKVCSQLSWCMTLISFVKDSHQSPSTRNPIKVLGILSSQHQVHFVSFAVSISFFFFFFLVFSTSIMPRVRNCIMGLAICGLASKSLDGLNPRP